VIAGVAAALLEPIAPGAERAPGAPPGLRSRAGTLAGLAALHALAAGWSAWFFAELAWSAAPVSASLAPLPRLALTGAGTASLLFVVAAGGLLGAAATLGPWTGPDPTRVLPVARGARLGRAWITSAAQLVIVAAGALPVWVALEALGAFAPGEIAAPALVQLAAVVAAPLPGIAAAALARGARW
jgi:hypothetical protein